MLLRPKITKKQCNCVASQYERQPLRCRVQSIHSRRRVDELQGNVWQLQRKCRRRRKRGQWNGRGVCD